MTAPGPVAKRQQTANRKEPETVRNFSDTRAANADAPAFPEDKYQKATDVMGLPLILLRANTADTQYGTSAFVHFNVLDDPEHIDYTTVFSEQSYAFQQVKELIDAKDFPIACTIAQWGKRSFQLANYDPANDPAKTRAHIDAWRYAALMAAANPKNKPDQPAVDHYDPDGTARDAKGNAVPEQSETDTTDVPF